jgi:hypothetical protein
MGRLELQVLDSSDNTTYADGHAGAYYGINPPAAIPVRPPGEWQTYDIVFHRPIYKNGQPVDPGYITAFLNGVMVQDHTPLEGSGGHMGRTNPGPFPEKGPLALQDHGNMTRFRTSGTASSCAYFEGGTDLAEREATMAKRQEIAAALARMHSFADPANPGPQMLRLTQPRVARRTPDVEKAQAMATAYATLKALPGPTARQADDAPDARHLPLPRPNKILPRISAQSRHRDDDPRPRLTGTNAVASARPRAVLPTCGRTTAYDLVGG